MSPKKFSPRGTFGDFWYVIPHEILHHMSHFPALYKFPPGSTLILPDYLLLFWLDKGFGEK